MPSSLTETLSWSQGLAASAGRPPPLLAGSGPGPGTYWTEALRWGTIEGDPRLVLLKATKTARRLGWTITRVECFSAATFHVSGWKQFDRFVALLSMGWSRDTEQFSIKAETPPVNAGGTNMPPAPSSEVELTRSCLVTGEDTSFYGGGGDSSETAASPDASLPADLLERSMTQAHSRR